MKVLLLDKDKTRIKLFKEVLNDPDYDILVAKHGKNAIKHLGEDSPELIITDFDVPGGGVDLVNAILTMNRDQFPYVLFIAEEQGEKYAVDCLGPIPGDFLLKPIKEQELRARISVAERAITLQSHLRSERSDTVDLAMYDELTNLMNRQAVY
ncbi:MAG: response regulator, partial [Anaerolineales bacterium]